MSPLSNHWLWQECSAQQSQESCPQTIVFERSIQEQLHCPWNYRWHGETFSRQWHVLTSTHDQIRLWNYEVQKHWKSSKKTASLRSESGFTCHCLVHSVPTYSLFFSVIWWPFYLVIKEIWQGLFRLATKRIL